MKKVLSLLAIAGLVACSNGETKPAGPDTTSQAYKDSVAKANMPAPAADTTKKDTAAAPKMDTAKPAAAPAEAPKH